MLILCAMQIKEKEKTYKRLREENEFAQKVQMHSLPLDNKFTFCC